MKDISITKKACWSVPLSGGNPPDASHHRQMWQFRRFPRRL